VSFRSRLTRFDRRSPAFVMTAVVVGIALLLIAWIIATQADDGVPNADDIAVRMEQRLPRVSTVQGRIELVNGAAVLEQELWIERPRRLRAEVEAGPPGVAPVGPNQKTTLVLSEVEAWFYNPNLGVATVTSRANYTPAANVDVGGSILESMPEAVLAALQNAADIQLIGEERVAGRQTLRVQMLLAQPQTPFDAQRITVGLDREFFYPLWIETDRGFALRFQSIQFNEAIDPATFVFVPPAGIVVNRINE
jgi:outer membrane lipoprotein-sorting protein